MRSAYSQETHQIHDTCQSKHKNVSYNNVSGNETQGPHRCTGTGDGNVVAKTYCDRRLSGLAHEEEDLTASATAMIDANIFEGHHNLTNKSMC